MKKILGAMALACALTLVTSCSSGPKRLSRGWDDWTNQKYTENAWLHGALFQDILPVYPIVGFALGVGDLFYNMFYFWGEDAWDNNGTGFNHENPANTTKTTIAVWKD